MSAPTPLTRFIHYPITAGVGIAAILATVLKASGRSIEPLVMNVLAFEGEPWRVLSSALPHGTWLHLLFNLIWLWTFGTIAESAWGPVRTAVIFVAFAAGSALAEYAAFYGGIGLSGVGYGLFGLMWVMARRDLRFVGVVDQRITLLFVVWFFVCIGLTAANIMNIGNVAHGVGGLMGVLLGLAITRRHVLARIASGGALALVIAASALGATLYRPLVNQAEYPGVDSAHLGYVCMDTGRDAEALHHLRRAIEMDRFDDQSWYNLGLALTRLELDPDGAVEAYRRAYEIDPLDPLHRKALSAALIRRGIARSEQDNLAAIELYKRGLAIDPTSAVGWFDLSLAYSKQELYEAALDAARRAYELDPTANELLADALRHVAALLEHGVTRKQRLLIEAAALSGELQLDETEAAD